MDTVFVPGLALDSAALDRARLSRDVRFDGRFFIAVISSGVYCRPICPTPTPKARNVRYYPTAAAAAEAGFRPCLRCRPEAAPSSPAWLGVGAVVRRGLRLIEQGALDEGSVSDLAERLGIGPRHLRRLFVEHVGASPIAVAQTRRLHFAKRLIDQTDLPMTQVALESGYGSLRRFNDAIRTSYRRTPSELRRRHRHGTTGSRRRSRGDGIVLRLAYRPPYDWQGFVTFLAARAVPEIEHADATRYTRTIVQDGKPAHITVRSPRGVDAIELELHSASGGALFELVSRVRRMFDLSVDPQRIEAALRRDALLAPLIESHPGVRIPGAWDGFECAVRAVLSQGSPLREQRLVSRLVRSCGSRVAFSISPEASLAFLFPTAQAIAVSNLQGIGLAAPQVTAVNALAEAYITGRVNFEAPAQELTGALVSLPSINHDTAEYIVLRALGEPDAFPAVSPGTCRQTLPGSRQTDASLAERSQSWRPWRGYAALHLWRAETDVQVSRKSRRDSAM